MINLSGRVPGQFIAGSCRDLYFRSDMLRLIISVFVAMALFFSPLVMMNGTAAAKPHGTLMGDAVAQGHCAGSDAPLEQGEPSTKLSCASTCAVVAPNSLMPIKQAPTARSLHPLACPRMPVGIDLEGETPPPRPSPEV